MANPDPAINYMLKFEGGYSNDPDDKGGPTNFGISRRFLLMLDDDICSPGTEDEYIRNLTLPRAIELYHIYFWRPAYDEINSQDVANYILDMAVNHGPAKSHKIAQNAAGVAVDGVMGPQTIRAINCKERHALLTEMQLLRANYYRIIAKNNPSQAKFLGDWLRRAAGMI
jgi:lysozyme family protein